MRRRDLRTGRSTSRYSRPDRQRHRDGVDDERGRRPDADQAVDQTEQVGIRVRLLVVFPAGTPQPAVLHRAVVAHLRTLQVGQVLADVLIDLLVVDRCGSCGAPGRRSGPAPAPSAASAGAGRADRAGAAGRAARRRLDRQPDKHAGLERPELKDFQLLTKRRSGRPQHPREQRREADDPRRSDDDDPRSGRRFGGSMLIKVQVASPSGRLPIFSAWP